MPSLPAAKLSVLVEALETQSDAAEHTYYDRQTGKTVRTDHAILVAVEEGDQQCLERVPEWQKPEIEAARAVRADRDGRFIPAPDIFDFREYYHMLNFIDTVDDPSMALQLSLAIQAPGASRNFKDAVQRLELVEHWYEYCVTAMKQFVIQWAKDNDVSYVDDLKTRRSGRINY